MLPHLSSSPENPSSPHFFGRHARAALQSARQKVADFFEVSPTQVIFTSGGTEGLNSCIKKEGKLITSTIEHPAILEPLASYPHVTYLNVGPWGAILREDLQAALTAETKQIILSAANSETGIKIDLFSIASLAQEYKIPLIIDGVAFLGKEELKIPSGVAAMVFSSHKIHGPKGVGCIILSPTFSFTSFIKGGGKNMAFEVGQKILRALWVLQKPSSSSLLVTT